MDYHTFFTNQVDRVRKDGRYRTFLNIERCAGHFPKAICRLNDELKEITIWCGNDYLGMGQHPQVIKAMIDNAKRCGIGSGGTRNISGTTHSHVKLEKELSDLHQKEAALVFTSGYVANETSLSTLGSHLPNCIFLSDEKNHASIIHGIRNSGAQKIIFRHNDVNHLQEILQKISREQPKIIVFESVYSMDGDFGPIFEICRLAKHYHALTFLDEVHGVGMYGRQGGGVAQQLELENEVDIIQGTLGKAFGTIGGYIAGNRDTVDFIRCYAPGFIFTTSLPPSIVAASVTSIRHLKSSSYERDRQHFNAQYLKQKLQQRNIPFLANHSHIVPVIIGDPVHCKEVSDELLNTYHIYAQPINYPTVPLGGERLRLTPSALHTVEMIDELVNALKEIWSHFALNKAA